MSVTFLERIAQETRARMAESAINSTDLEADAFAARELRPHHLLRDQLARRDRTNIVAEIKRASPSKGVINGNIDVADVAQSYARGGAVAISVLTEPEYFGGSLYDLITARKAVALPLLRKDFTVSELQIYEAAAAGGDAVLLIAAILSTVELSAYSRLAEDILGMDAIVEVHTVDELRLAQDIGASLIGVNNRDLHSLEVSLDVSRELIRYRQDDSLMISESGISSTDEITELKDLGFNGFLIGESLMRSADAAGMLGGWV
jgi:indole-3-glycerol phosphate synthase